MQIIHGVLAHKDQVYHKKLANRLAEERGWDSFRYDLRGEVFASPSLYRNLIAKCITLTTHRPRRRK